MKKKKNLLSGAMIFLIGGSIFGQNSYSQRLKRDSIEIASLADSIKEYPKKAFPNGTEFKWTVSGLEEPKKDTLYKRPSYAKKGSSDKNTIKSAPEPMVYYTASVSDKDNNHLGTVEFSRPKSSNKVAWYKTLRIYSKMDEIKGVVPAEVLKKIVAELKAQANEDISLLGIVTYADAEKTASQYEGDKVKEFAGEKKLEDKSFYWVHGTVNGSKTNGSYFFTMKGDYIPCYEHDAWYNKTMKFKE